LKGKVDLMESRIIQESHLSNFVFVRERWRKFEMLFDVGFVHGNLKYTKLKRLIEKVKSSNYDYNFELNF
jgi:hypothetical protein